MVLPWRQKNRIEDGDGRWLAAYSNDRYAVSKTENRKRRLPWNNVTLADVPGAYDKKMMLSDGMWLIRYALTNFSGRRDGKV